MKKNVQLSRKLLEFLELLQTLVTFSMHQLNESDRRFLMQSCRKEHEMTKRIYDYTLKLTTNSQPDPDRLKIVCEFQRLSLREENYPFIYHKAIKEDLHLYEIRWPFRHHELFYYNKKLFIHYFLVPGRQVPFLVPIGRQPMNIHKEASLFYFPKL